MEIDEAGGSDVAVWQNVGWLMASQLIEHILRYPFDSDHKYQLKPEPMALGQSYVPDIGRRKSFEKKSHTMSFALDILARCLTVNGFCI